MEKGLDIGEVIQEDFHPNKIFILLLYLTDRYSGTVDALTKYRNYQEK